MRCTIRQAIAAWLCAVLPGCEPAPPDRAAPLAVHFVDVASQAGIDFVHTSGRSGRKYGVETIGSGAVFFDYDGDGWIDLYAVNGADLPGHRSPQPPRNRLYRNEGDGTFAEVGEEAGAADGGYGMGAVAGDYDNDGDADLFVANFGPNVLYRNEGDGSFADLTRESGLQADTSWSTGSAWVDYDVDGDLDLYVANYLDYSFEEDLLEGGVLRRPRRHLAPTEYPGRRDFLYRNDGGDRFADVTAEAGLLSLECRELGALFFDYDEDGDADLFQGNDATPNFLYRNEGNGRFSEVGLAAGVAYNEAGKPEGTMGVDAADVDGDGRLDLAMTNFQWESNTLYVNLGGGLFRDASMEAGIAADSFDRLAFGINFFDADLDGDMDLYVVNGHIDEDIERFDPQATYGQKDQLYLNDGSGHFTEIGARAGPGMEEVLVGRGSAAGDYDNDGDVDLFVLNTGQRGLLLRNDTPRHHHYLALSLEGRQSNRDGYGARVLVVAGGRAQVAEKRSTASYLSQNDPRLYFGLGTHTRAERVEITWPSGVRQVLEGVEGDRVVRVVEPEGVARPVRSAEPAAERRLSPGVGDLELAWQEAPMVLPEKVRAALPDSGLSLSALAAAARRAPGDVQAGCALADGLRRAHQHGRAEAEYRRVLEVDPECAPAWTGLGQVLVARDRAPEALAAFSRASSSDSMLAAPHYFAGNVLVRQGRLEEAVSRYERALSLDPGYLQAYFNLTGLHARQTDYGLALEVLSRGLERMPGQVELLFQLGRVHFVQARYTQALERLQQVVAAEPERAEAWELLAQIHLNQKERSRALAVLEEGLKAAPESALLRARTGILLMEEGRTEEAVGLLRAALAADPDREEVYYNLGQTLLRQGRPEEGHQLLDYFGRLQKNHGELLDYKTAIVLNPADAGAFYSLGASYSRMGRYQAALEAYSAALQIDPEHVDALNNLGNIHLRRRQVERAIAAYERALRLNPDYARAHQNLGSAYLLAGQQQRAEAAFLRAAALDPGYALPRESLAQLYQSQGRLQEERVHREAYRRLRAEESGP